MTQPFKTDRSINTSTVRLLLQKSKYYKLLQMITGYIYHVKFKLVSVNIDTDNCKSISQKHGDNPTAGVRC